MKTKIAIVLVLIAAVVAIALYNHQTKEEVPAKTEAIATTSPIERDDFISLYVDLELIAEKAGIGTAAYEVARDSVLKSHGVSINDVTAMLAIADGKPEEWAEIWERILDELEARKAALAEPDSTAIH